MFPLTLRRFLKHSAACLLVAAVVLASCVGERVEVCNRKGIDFRYATLLRGERTDSFVRIDVLDPWDTSQVAMTYVLVPRSHNVPTALPHGTLVRTPLQRLVAFSAVHASLCNELGRLSHVSGVCDAEYVGSAALKKALHNGTLRNFGSAMQPSTEQIIQAGADALLISPFRDRVPGPAERLGIPVIACADYMEASPLARAEWVKFFGLLLNCESTADSIFARVEKTYNDLKATAAHVKQRPTLMIDLKTGPVWYVAGGRSTMGTLYHDAGLTYQFADNAERGSVALDFEQVFSRCAQSEYWLIKYGEATDKTYASLLLDEPRYRHFRPWRERHIACCNTLRTPYYEETPFHPERLLSELIYTFHPELRPTAFQPRYIFPLQEQQTR